MGPAWRLADGGFRPSGDSGGLKRVARDWDVTTVWSPRCDLRYQGKAPQEAESPGRTDERRRDRRSRIRTGQPAFRRRGIHVRLWDEDECRVGFRDHEFSLPGAAGSDPLAGDTRDGA